MTTPRLIETAVFDGQRFTLQWAAAAGINYQVQSSVDLVTWQDAGSVISGSNSTQAWTDDRSATPAEPGGALLFYRVKQLP